MAGGGHIVHCHAVKISTESTEKALEGKKKKQIELCFLIPQLFHLQNVLPSPDLPLRSSSDVHSCLAVPEDGQVLVREVHHSVVACFPKLKL